MRTRTTLQLAFAGIVTMATCLPQVANAIPYFARKYKTTCSRCHTAVPKLNSFGKNFQLFGYQQPGDKMVDKESIPEDTNLTLINRAPIAFLVENSFSADKYVNSNQSPAMISSPTVFHLFAADSIAPDLGFFGEVATQGGATDVGKVSLIASFVGGQNFHFQVGQIDPVEHGVTEHDLFGRSGYALQDLDISGTNLANQRQGIRLFGTFGSAVTANLIHGKAEPAKEEKKEGSVHPGPFVKQDKQEMEDESDPMNVLKGSLWEVALYNSNNPGGGRQKDIGDYAFRFNQYFNGDSFVGLMAFAGRTTVGAASDLNKYSATGLDFSMGFGKKVEKTTGMKIHEYNLLGSYLNGHADNPADDGNRANFKGYFLDLQKVIGGRAIASLKYDRLFLDDGIANLAANGSLHTNALTANYTYYLRTNFWVGLEYTRDLTAGGKNHNLGAVFSFAF